MSAVTEKWWKKCNHRPLNSHGLTVCHTVSLLSHGLTVGFSFLTVFQILSGFSLELAIS